MNINILKSWPVLLNTCIFDIQPMQILALSESHDNDYDELSPVNVTHYHLHYHL